MNLNLANRYKSNEWSCSPIMAINVYRNHLFVGEGGYVLIWDLREPKGSSPRYYEVLPSNFSITDLYFVERNEEIWVMVIGGKAFRQMEFRKSDDGTIDFDHYSLGVLQQTDDAIMAGRWMSNGDLILVKGNNTFVLYALNSEPLVKSYSKENIFEGEVSVLYTAEICGEELKKTVVFVGTVFSKIDVYLLKDNVKDGHFRQNTVRAWSFSGHDVSAYNICICII